MWCWFSGADQKRESWNANSETGSFYNELKEKNEKDPSKMDDTFKQIMKVTGKAN
jgi:hypothetical protein